MYSMMLASHVLKAQHKSQKGFDYEPRGTGRRALMSLVASFGGLAAFVVVLDSLK